MSARRKDIIAESICYSIVHSDRRPGLFQKLPAYFYAYWLTFVAVREDLFTRLREEWNIKAEDYQKSFSASNALKAMGDMGYSGSTFYVSRDGAWLVKSIPRHFEHSFFKNDLLLPYAEHMHAYPSSLLVRITDFLACAQHSVGTVFGLAPSHHIVMENILHGQADDQRDGDNAEWEKYDLKPMSYFYPERDIANGTLASEATKSRLADDFNDKLSLSPRQASDFHMELQRDTQLLAKCNAVDYSLFLVRIPASEPCVPQDPPSWRTGVHSADGNWVYRAAILDFFWAKHKVHAQAMTGLIKSYNLIDKQGPMSITTTAPEYRERFLKMCDRMVEAERKV